MKRVKLKGGRVRYEQTLYFPTSEAVANFENEIWNIYRQPSQSKAEGYYRIICEIRWEPKETAEAWNVQQKGKRK